MGEGAGSRALRDGHGQRHPAAGAVGHEVGPFLGLGLAAAVHALDIALSLSLAFNLVVLALWRFDDGIMNGAGAALSMGRFS